MKILGISQYEEKRYKVIKGREIHDKKEKENREYLRKKLGVIDKEIDVLLVSDKYKIRGKVDEILTLADKTMAPLDYKFAKYEDKIYNTYKTQMIMYSLMIKEIYDVDVKKGFLVYCRGGNTIKEVDISERDILKLEKDLKEYIKILDGYYPKATNTKRRCVDCTYRNICIK
jgi:CRISPR-associated exonuclease Cas4